MAVDRIQLAQWISEELSNAEGFQGGELQDMRKGALDRYYGRPTGDEKPGRSRAQSNDVADMVEAIVATMLPGFANDKVCEFEADSNDDIQQAALESDVVNDVIIEANRGYVLFQEAVRDALLLRNGWIKAYSEELEEITTERFVDVPEEVLPRLVGQELPVGTTREITNPVDGTEEGLISFTIKQTRIKQKVKVQSVDPVNMRWRKNNYSVFVSDLPFLSEDWYPTRSELVERGYSKKVVYDLAAADYQSIDQLARARDGVVSGFQPADESTQNVLCRWCHYRYDSDGDGVAELHRVLYADGDKSGVILDDEMVSFIPYATGTPFLQPHRLDGMGVYDKVRSVEANKTEILRSWLDNLNANNNVRMAINSRVVEVDDAVNSRPGGIIRVMGEVGPNIMPIPIQDTGSSALAALEYQDKIRSERGGASLDLTASGQQVGAETAHGIERQMSSREQLAAMMARTLAETLVRETYIMVHRGLREWINQPIKAQVAGRFVESNPGEWRERDRVNVQTGLSYSERMRRRSALEMVISQQEKMAAAGYSGVLVNAQNYHSAIMDWSRAAEIDNADRYFLDPASEESQQAAQAQQEKAEELENMQLQIAATSAQAEQQKALIEQAVSKYKADVENAFKYWSESLGAEIEMLKVQNQSLQAEMQMAVGQSRSAVSASQASDSAVNQQVAQ